MNPIDQDRQRLRNAIRQNVAGLTAVEVDTVVDAREVIAELRPTGSDQPSAVVEFDARTTLPELLLEETRTAVAGWPSERGVVFVVDLTGPDETEPVEFWRGMNFLREGWDALAVHLVFLLLPLNYRLLVTVADHLADWIPLRFHFRPSPADTTSREMNIERSIGVGMLSPRVARQRLEQLEPALSEALAQGTDPATVLRRFYLPMFQAAVSLGDHHRAASLFRHIDERSLAKSDLPGWWQTASTYHLDCFELDKAAQMAHRLLEYAQQVADETTEGTAMGQLGRIAQKRRDFTTAEQWHGKALAIWERQNNERGTAGTCYQLGLIAQDKRDFVAAEQWYRKALVRWENGSIEHGVASCYHQLGRVAEDLREFNSAERWYRKTLAIREKQGEECEIGNTYHQLGRIAEELRDFAVAEQWYRKGLAVFEKQGNEYRTAAACHQLGVIAHKQHDLVSAEHWYRKALEIWRKRGDERSAAGTYHQLGMIAQDQRDIAAAEQWYGRSLEVSSKRGDERLTASTSHQLGRLAHQQRDFAAAEQWYRKAVTIWEKLGDEHNAAITFYQLGQLAQERRYLATARQWYQKSLAINEKESNEDVVADIYYKLGMIAQDQRDFAASEQWYRTALMIWENRGDQHSAASVCVNLGLLAGLQHAYEEAGMWLVRSLRSFAVLNDLRYIGYLTRHFVKYFRQADPDTRLKLASMWREAELGELPEVDEEEPAKAM